MQSLSGLQRLLLNDILPTQTPSNVLKTHHFKAIIHKLTTCLWNRFTFRWHQALSAFSLPANTFQHQRWRFPRTNRFSPSRRTQSSGYRASTWERGSLYCGICVDGNKVAIWGCIEVVESFGIKINPQLSEHYTLFYIQKPWFGPSQAEAKPWVAALARPEVWGGWSRLKPSRSRGFQAETALMKTATLRIFNNPITSRDEYESDQDE